MIEVLGLKDLNYPDYIAQAKEYQWNIIPVDRDHADMWGKREAGMVESLKKSVLRPCIYVVGAKHLVPMRLSYGSTLQEQFELLYVRLTDIATYQTNPRSLEYQCLYQDPEVFQFAENSIYIGHARVITS